MDTIEQLLSLITARDYLAVAVLVIGWLVQLSRPESKFPLTLPPIFGRDPKPLLSLLLGTAYGVLVLHKSGESWLLAARNGAAVGLLTMGAFAIVVKFVWNGSPPAWVDALALIFPKKADAASKNHVDGPKGPGVPPGVVLVVGALLAAGAAGVVLSGCSFLQSPAGQKTVLFGFEELACIYEHDTEPVLKIASDCLTQTGPDILREIETLLAAKRAGEARKATARAALCSGADAGLDAKADAR